MSYTRSAWKREFVFGDSHLYSFIGTDGNLWFIGSSCNEDGFEVIKKEDVFEFIVNVLRHADIELSKDGLRKLAKELKVKLRKRPLSWEEMRDDMERKCRKRRKKHNEDWLKSKKVKR